MRTALTQTMGFAERPHVEGVEDESAQPVQEHDPGKAEHVDCGHMEEDVRVRPGWCMVLRPERGFHSM